MELGTNITNPPRFLDYKLSPAGDQYITGYFSSDSMVIGNQVLYKIATGSASDIFFAKFDSAGNFNWVKQYGNPVTNSMRGFGISFLSQGVALTGIANQGADIGGFIFRIRYIL